MRDGQELRHLVRGNGIDIIQEPKLAPSIDETWSISLGGSPRSSPQEHRAGS